MFLPERLLNLMNNHFFAAVKKHPSNAKQRFNPMQTVKPWLLSFIAGSLAFSSCGSSSATNEANPDSTKTAKASSKQSADSNTRKPADAAEYNRLMTYLANGDTTGRWPVKDAAMPQAGAILPFNRVIAYYGNLYSNRMGALGKWPKH